MRDRSDCTCRCHKTTFGYAKHMVPCCVGVLRVSDENREWAARFTRDCVHTDGSSTYDCTLCIVRRALKLERELTASTESDTVTP